MMRTLALVSVIGWSLYLAVATILGHLAAPDCRPGYVAEFYLTPTGWVCQPGYRTWPRSPFE